MTQVRITRLSDRESRLLHAIERSIVHWQNEVAARNYAGRNENERDICCEARDHLYELRSLLLDGE